MQVRPSLALAISAAFTRGELDFALRPAAPIPGWDAMPECVAAERVRRAGGSSADIRLVITFTAAMDRARDADRLWSASARLYESEPWAFDPNEVRQRPLLDLTDALRSLGVSQRHTADAAAWRTIAESLASHDRASLARRAVYEGVGDAQELLNALTAATSGGSHLFPLLRGPKVGPMWVRMLAYPGGAQISSLEVVPVAVDVQVRRVTEYLAVTDTGPVDLDDARAVIQEAWHAEVERGGTEGPEGLAGTAGALDPALWFWGKWGCSVCERAGRKLPVADPCAVCRFPARS
jgi:hypothetical protein